MLTPNLTHWYCPPVIIPSSNQLDPDRYFLQRLFFWMPRRMYSYDFKCPNCDKSLQSKIIYNHVHLVLDVKEFYYLATEKLDCNACKGHLSATMIEY